MIVDQLRLPLVCTYRISETPVRRATVSSRPDRVLHLLIHRDERRTEPASVKERKRRLARKKENLSSVSLALLPEKRGCLKRRMVR